MSLFYRFIVLLLLTGGLALAEVRVTARFEPETLAVGQTGRYILSAQGNTQQVSRQFTIPEGGNQLTFPRSVDVLGQQTSQNFEMNSNGVSLTKSYVVTVRPREIGTVIIPAYEIQLGNQVYPVPEARLEVVASGSQTQGNTSSLTDEVALKLMFARPKIYVGEAMPAQLQLFLPTDVRIYHNRNHPFPQPQGDAFSLAPFDFDQVTEETISKDGTPRLKYAFPTVVTPLKAGTQTLIYEYPITLARRDSRMGPPSLFDTAHLDQLFNQMMGMGGQPEQISLSTGELAIEVLPLPTKNQPKSFSGAIGQFEATQELSDVRGLRVGEPITLKLTLRGEGNFSRIQPPPLPESADWRAYDPRSEFRQEDAFGTVGVKTFEYVIIPQKPGKQLTPTLEFSFFDPLSERYETIELPPSQIEVIPSPLSSPTASATETRKPTPQPKETDAPEAKPKSTANTPTLLDIQTQASSQAPSLNPLFTRQRFWVVNALIALLMAITYFILARQYRLKNDADYALRKRLRKRCRQHLSHARRTLESDPLRSLTESEHALRTAVGCRFARDADSLTRSDLEHALHNAAVDESALAAARALLDAAEASKYAGGNQSAPWNAALLAKLEPLIKDLTHGHG